MNKKILKNIEWSVVVCVILLLIIGLVALASATQNSEYDELKKQLLWIGVSLPILILVISIDYELLIRISPFLYGGILILLIAVLFTEAINGAKSWFVITDDLSFQPAEFAKIFVLLFFAWYINKIQKKDKEDINNLIKLVIGLLIIGVPVLLILVQPDYGTAMAFILALVFILYISGINKKYILAALIFVIIAIPVMYFFVLPDHAKTRIEVYLDPNIDPRGDGYNILQSKLAIGAGQLTGMGLFNGNQTQLGYLYPKTTDFIFALVSEEMGFIAASGVIILYVILITKAINIAKTSKDDLGGYIASGIAGILFFHMVENIGMTMGLLPITGIPLPFVSYGGSSMLTNFIMIGLLLNISGRRQKRTFVE